jgi:hypothetical protein
MFVFTMFQDVVLMNRNVVYNTKDKMQYMHRVRHFLFIIANRNEERALEILSAAALELQSDLSKMMKFPLYWSEEFDLRVVKILLRGGYNSFRFNMVTKEPGLCLADPESSDEDVKLSPSLSDKVILNRLSVLMSAVPTVTAAGYVHKPLAASVQHGQMSLSTPLPSLSHISHSGHFQPGHIAGRRAGPAQPRSGDSKDIFLQRIMREAKNTLIQQSVQHRSPPPVAVAHQPQVSSVSALPMSSSAPCGVQLSSPGVNSSSTTAAVTDLTQPDSLETVPVRTATNTAPTGTSGMAAVASTYSNGQRGSIKSFFSAQRR